MWSLGHSEIGLVLNLCVDCLQGCGERAELDVLSFVDPAL